MALTPNTWGTNIATALKNWAQANLPQNSFVTDGQLQQAWIVITTEDKEHINDFADIELDSADIAIDPGTFCENIPTPNTPITGQGINHAVTLNQKIR